MEQERDDYAEGRPRWSPEAVEEAVALAVCVGGPLALLLLLLSSMYLISRA